jgi:RNase H-like domain found in reverse transcriptase/Reverse transcriptase (RNA-dependent DNA polymerase)/Integrase zinc binding domain/Integrase core domain
LLILTKQNDVGCLVAMHDKDITISDLAVDTINVQTDKTTGGRPGHPGGSVVEPQGLPGKKIEYEGVILLADSRRFKFDPTATEAEDYMRNNQTFIDKLRLPAFDPPNEKKFEEWVDSVATVVGTRMPVLAFATAWCNASAEHIRNTFDSFSITSTTKKEELVDFVAMDLFPESDYVRELEYQLLGPIPFPTVKEAKKWVTLRLARYVRLIRRRNRPLGINDVQLLELTISCFPPPVAAEMMKQAFSDINELFITAARVERAQTYLDQRTLKGEPAAAVLHPVPTSTPIPVLATSPYTCHCCGSTTHMRRQCPHKTSAVCTNCGFKGHMAATCRSHAFRDSTGRIRATVTATPSSIVTKSRHDRTTKERLDTMEATVQLMRERLDRANSGVKRKPGLRDMVRRKPKKLDPVEETSPTVTGAVINEEVLSDAYLIESETELPTILEVQGLINGYPAILRIDTGAVRSFCPPEIAQRLRLNPGTTVHLFHSVTDTVRGTRQKPVEVEIMGRSANISFTVPERSSPYLPILLGLTDLFKLGLEIKRHENKFVVVPASCNEDTVFIAEGAPLAGQPIELTNGKSVNDSVTDTVAQVDVRKTDNELLRDAYEDYVKRTDHLSEPYRSMIWELLQEYKEVWLRPKSGCTKTQPLEFEVRGSPVKHKVRHVPEPVRIELEKQLDSLQENNVIRMSKSPWASRVLFVQKKDGGLRMVIDYREVNEKMVSDAYPLPLLWDNIQKAAHHEFYVVLDANWGFWNIPLSENSKKYTAFVTHKGTYEFNVLPFGLKNAPGNFQRIMDEIFDPLYSKGLSTFVDDIVIAQNGFQATLKLLEQTLARCRQKGLYLKFSKFKLFQPTVSVLGHVVGLSGIMPDPRKVSAVHRAAPPATKKVLQSFLGTASYLRRFVPGFAAIASPLYDLLAKGAKWEWSEEANAAFESLKGALSEEVLLTAPSGNGQFTIATDASDKGIGCVLMQEQEGELRILEFGSRKFSHVERRWDTREREAYAVKWAVEHYSDYILLGKVRIYTDHESLKWMASSTKGKVVRWTLFLRQYDLEIHHISGEENVIADWLSRAWEDEPNDDELVDQIAVPMYHAVETPAKLEQPRLFAPEVPKVHEIQKALTLEKPLDYLGTYEGPDGLRYSQRTSKLYIPKVLRESILWWFHASKYGGHAGVNRTRRRLNKFVWWPGMTKSVQEYIGGCIYCIRRQPTKPKTLRGALTKAIPFQLVSLDYIGPRSAGMNTWYIMIIVDHATRFMMAKVTDSPSAAHAVRLLKYSWCAVFGAPLAILTDRGAAFRDKAFHEFVVQQLGAYHVFTSPYYPQGNAINEASHKALEYSLSAALRDTNDLEDAVHDSVLVHNATPNIATGESPYYAVYGTELVFPGWQRLAPSNTPLRAKYVQNELRLQSMLTERLVQEERQLENAAADVQVGTWVVFPLGEHESKFVSHPHVTNDKYSPKWSLPAKVLQVKEAALTVATLGCPERTRDVPRAACRKLKYDVPASLVNLALETLNYEAPRYAKAFVIPRGGPSARPRSWHDLLDERQQLDQAVSAKRPRVAPQVSPPHTKAAKTTPGISPASRLGGELIGKGDITPPSV